MAYVVAVPNRSRHPPFSLLLLLLHSRLEKPYRRFIHHNHHYTVVLLDPISYTSPPHLAGPRRMHLHRAVRMHISDYANHVLKNVTAMRSTRVCRSDLPLVTSISVDWILVLVIFVGKFYFLFCNILH
jgi:hypothetical protein